jgi:hypothetical protein
MNRDEFSALPPSIALGLLFDALPQLASVELPQLPRPQKYDGKLSRRGGQFCWLSEMNLESLIFWEKTKRESAEKGGQYAEKDRKTADALAYWVKWRRVFPNEPWSGLRNDVRVTAAPPSRDPKLYSWDDVKRNGGGASAPADDGYGAAPAGNGQYGEDDYGSSGDDSNIPF